MITEDYVSFETAKLLKENGFDEIKCNTCYKWNGKFCNNRLSMSGVDNEICVQAPTLQMAMKWLREVHNYHIEIERNFEYFHNGIMHKPSYDAAIQDTTNKDKNYFVAECNIYEEACEAAIKYCLENLV